jgi:hypothetical protein
LEDGGDEVQAGVAETRCLSFVYTPSCPLACLAGSFYCLSYRRHIISEGNKPERINSLNRRGERGLEGKLMFLVLLLLTQMCV